MPNPPRNTLLDYVTVACSVNELDPDRLPLNFTVGHLIEHDGTAVVMVVPDGCGGFDMTPAAARELARTLTLAAERADGNDQ